MGNFPLLFLVSLEGGGEDEGLGSGGCRVLFQVFWGLVMD